MAVLNLSDTPEKKDAAVVIASHENRVKQIRSNEQLSDQGKVAHLARNYLDTRAQLDALRAKETGAVETTRADLQRRLFGGGSDPAAQMSFRDALDRASKLTTPSAAHAALSQAAITGDVLLSKAIGLTADGKGWTDVVNHYVADAGVQDVLDELRQLDAGDPRAVRLASDMAFSLALPSELKSHRNNLSALAAKAPAATAVGSNPPSRGGSGGSTAFPFLADETA